MFGVDLGLLIVNILAERGGSSRQHSATTDSGEEDADPSAADKGTQVWQVPQNTFQSALQLQSDCTCLQADLEDALEMQRHAHKSKEARAQEALATNACHLETQGQKHQAQLRKRAP